MRRRPPEKSPTGEPVPVPDEVGFFSRAEWQNFLRAVQNDMERRGLVAEVDGTNLSRAASGWSASLINLAQICYREPDDRWALAISAHFDSLLSTGPVTSADEPDAEVLIVEQMTAEEARQNLRVRIYPPDFIGEGRITRIVTPGLVAGLAIDLPDAVESVSPEQIQAWGLGVDEAFRVGYDNVRRNDKATVGGQRPDGEPELVWLTSSSFFVTTNVMWLEQLIGPLPAAGALVAVPHRHAVIVHPMTDLGHAVSAVNVMLMLAKSAFEAGPGSLSPSLYWWTDGQIIHLPGEVDGETIRFRPPEAFLLALDQLASAGATANITPEPVQATN